MTAILGLDPGKTTGAVLFEASDIATGVVSITWEIQYEDMPEWLDAAIGTLGIDLIAMERFVISRRTLESSRVQEPMDVIGGVKFLAALADPPIYVKMQSASDAKTAYADDRLEELGLYGQVPRRHERDALRHALLATHTMGRDLRMNDADG